MARSVQVVLREDLPNVGDSGEVVKVKPGYARNFLIPRGLAAMATQGNVKQIEHEKRVALARAAKQREVAKDVAKKLEEVRVTLSAKVGEEQKLYGSITSRDIEEGLAKLGFEKYAVMIEEQHTKFLEAEEKFEQLMKEKGKEFISGDNLKAMGKLKRKLARFAKKHVPLVGGFATGFSLAMASFP